MLVNVVLGTAGKEAGGTGVAEEGFLHPSEDVATKDGKEMPVGMYVPELDEGSLLLVLLGQPAPLKCPSTSFFFVIVQIGVHIALFAPWRSRLCFYINSLIDMIKTKYY